MWRTLLLVAHAACDWVEISQQHYRKPARTTTTEVYTNQTIHPVTWTEHRIIDTRVEVSRKKHIPDIVDVQKPDSAKNEFLGTVEKVPNVGVIRRVKIPNTPVKSPSIENTSAVNKLYSNFHISLDESQELGRRVLQDNRKLMWTTEATVNTDEKNKLNNYSVIAHEHNYFVTSKSKITNDDFNTFRSKGKINKISHDDLATIFTKIVSEETHDKLNKNHGIPNFDTTDTTNKNNEYDEKIKQNKPNPSRFENVGSNDNLEHDKVHEGLPTEGTPTPNTMEVLINVMKTVADTISKNSHRSLSSKMRYLHRLKNTLLENIENRVDSIWPDDTDAQNDAKRRARSAHDSGRAHVEFPSSESSLMTISFLTFAVFLIKLVLQVIQTYKNKAMMVAPLVVATAGRAAVQRLQGINKHND